MLKIEKFTGLNNVDTPEKLGAGDLQRATNVDIGNARELMRRQGYSVLSEVCHKNVWDADGFQLATRDGGDLVAIADGDDPEDAVVLYPSLGVDRVWYCNLPDGRTTFSNGLINGIASATAATKWGVPVPSSIGTGEDASGSLFAGDYRWALTHVRTSDGLEGGPLYSAPIEIPANGAIVLSDLPVLAGHSINVYLTGHDGAEFYYAGNTAISMFSFSGPNKNLVRKCETEFCRPAPVGTVTALWRNRALVAVGPVLYASRPGRFELFNLLKDFKQFSADITLIQPVQGGVFVGTEKELVFLAGEQFDSLALNRSSTIAGRVVLGSGVTVPGHLIGVGKGRGEGDCMVCIANGYLVAGLASGAVVPLTEGRYHTEVTEVAATFRVRDGIPQYIAIEQ
jgi:hypothetical protein